MAKALTDFRLLDLPLSVPFYKWLLRQERSMTLQDVHLLDASLANTLSQLAAVARRRRQLEADQTLTAEQRRAAIEALGVDGCSVEDLGLDFTLPGHSSIELKRGGRDEPLTIHNLDQYLKVGHAPVCGHWTSPTLGIVFSCYQLALMLSSQCTCLDAPLNPSKQCTCRILIMCLPRTLLSLCELSITQATCYE